MAQPDINCLILPDHGMRYLTIDPVYAISICYAVLYLLILECDDSSFSIALSFMHALKAACYTA